MLSAPAARQITSHAPDALYRFIAVADERNCKKRLASERQKQQTLFTIEKISNCATRHLLISRRRVRSQQRRLMRALGG
jgi:hypothetical protein